MRAANELVLNRPAAENWPFSGDLMQVHAPELTAKHVERDSAQTDPSEVHDIDLASKYGP
jgi:hypothetical protein